MFRWSVCLVCLVSLPIQAEMYKWTDAQGNVHFTDQPPADTRSEELDIKPPARIGQDENVRGIQERLQRLRQAEQEQYQQEEAARTEAAKKEKEARAACTRARRELAKYEGPVYRTRDDGSVHFLTDEEYAVRKAEIGKWLEENCKGY